MSTLEFGDYFSTRDAKDYRSMTSAELDEEIKYTEEILDFHRSLNGSGDPVLRGFIETDLKSLLAEKARRTGASKNSNPGSKSIRKWIDLMESIEEQEIDWLWRDRIARGRLTEFLGDPGIGKSHASQAIAADLSVGRALPGDVEPEAPLRTLILNFEDGVGDTIKPHLRMLGADMTMVGVPAKSNRLLPSQFNANILENMLREFPAALVVVDPALAIMSKRNTDRASDVRDVLSPLADLAMCKKFKPPFFFWSELYRRTRESSPIWACPPAHRRVRRRSRRV